MKLPNGVYKQLPIFGGCFVLCKEISAVVFQRKPRCGAFFNKEKLAHGLFSCQKLCCGPALFGAYAGVRETCLFAKTVKVANGCSPEFSVPMNQNSLAYNIDIAKSWLPSLLRDSESNSYPVRKMRFGVNAYNNRELSSQEVVIHMIVPHNGAFLPSPKIEMRQLQSRNSKGGIN